MNQHLTYWVTSTKNKRYFTTIAVSFEHKVNFIFKNNKDEFIKKLNNNNAVEKQLAELNIACWISCIREYGKDARGVAIFLF